MLTITAEPAALGATVSGLDLHQPLAPELVEQIRAALLRHQVLFFPEASLSPVEQIRLGHSFGSLQCHASLDTLAEHPEVVVFDTALGCSDRRVVAQRRHVRTRATNGRDAADGDRSTSGRGDALGEHDRGL